MKARLPEWRKWFSANAAGAAADRLAQLTHTRSLMSGPWAVAASFEKAAEQANPPEARRRALRQLAAEGRAIRHFMADPPVRPILLSTDAGAVGLNLQAGNIVVNYDLPWNPMLIEQRFGRVQRLGQKAAKVVVYNLVLKGTIEDHIVLRLMERLNLFTQAIGEMEELLDRCGYDEKRRPLEEVIMDLVRKAAEQKDISDDLRRMEESRREAEAKIREMRAATEQALASIKPADADARLTGLERVAPRLERRELIKGPTCSPRPGFSSCRAGLPCWSFHGRMGTRTGRGGRRCWRSATWTGRRGRAPQQADRCGRWTPRVDRG